MKDSETMKLKIRTGKDIQAIELLTEHPEGWVEVEGKYEWKKLEKPLQLDYETEEFRYWSVEHRPQNHQMRYGFLLKSEREECLYVERGYFQPDDAFIKNDINSYFAFPYMHTSEVFRAPEWVKETVWYQIMPDRFYNPMDKNWGQKQELDQYSLHGGTLKGVIEKLPYLQKLGITGLYLTPVFKSPTAHKYDTTDYYQIDPNFGTKQELKSLVKEAHDRGMKVLLDGVFNHIGEESEVFKDVLDKGKKSKYYDWFYLEHENLFDEKGQRNSSSYRHFTPNMPKLNTLNPEVQSYILDIAEYWIKETNCDGWRLDVANEVDHHFWKLFRKKVKAVKSDAYIIGEIWHNSDPWLKGDEFDGVMNYPLSKPILEWLASERIDSNTFVEQFVRALTQYSDNVNQGMMTLLDSHDTERLLTYAEGDQRKAEMCLALLSLLPGSLSLYYGTEIGMTGGEDPNNRKPMKWENEGKHPLYQFIQRILEQRKKQKDLFCANDFAFEKLKGGGLLIRKETGNAQALFIVNRSLEAIKITSYIEEDKESEVRDIKKDKIVSEKDTIEVDAKDYGFFLVKKFGTF
jgi:cyclomaltodextrinase